MQQEQGLSLVKVHGYSQRKGLSSSVQVQKRLIA